MAECGSFIFASFAHGSRSAVQKIGADRSIRQSRILVGLAGAVAVAISRGYTNLVGSAGTDWIPDVAQGSVAQKNFGLDTRIGSGGVEEVLIAECSAGAAVIRGRCTEWKTNTLACAFRDGAHGSFHAVPGTSFVAGREGILQGFFYCIALGVWGDVIADTADGVWRTGAVTKDF